MKFLPLQNNFSAGELSPRFNARSDMPGYQAGLQLVENFIPTTHGPIARRPGTKHISDVNGTTGKLFHFPADSSKGFVVVITDHPQLLVFSMDDGTLQYQTTTSINYSVAEIPTVQVAISPEGNSMYMFCATKQTRKLDYDRATTTFSFATAGWTSQPPEWGTPSFPSCGCFFQGRLWAGGAPDNPNMFWASRSGVYLDMYIASGSAADDPLSFSMSKWGRVSWLAGVKNLMVGTDTGEFIITSEGGVITPSDIQATQQSANGSGNVQPVEIGNNVIYVSPDGRKARDVGFQWTQDAWVSRDITYVSEHITADNLIQQIVFAQNPENLLLMSTSAGNVLGCTYEANNQIIGWCRLDYKASVHSICTVTVDGKNLNAILTTDSDSHTTDRLHLEMWDENVHLDNYAEDTGNTISSSHLSDCEVSVLIDGAVHPNVTLDGSGNATLQRSGTLVQYGLPFVSTAKTLPLDRGHPAGSAMPTRKGYNKIYLRLIDSAMPWVGTQMPPDRNPLTPMNQSQDMVTGDVFVTNLGWDQYAHVVVVQNLPLPTMVGGIFGEAAQETL